MADTMVLDALNASAAAVNASSKQKDVLSSVLAEMGLLNQSTAAATDSKTSGINVVEGQQLLGAQQAQDKAIAFANQVNANGDTPQEMMVKLGARLSESLQAAQVAEDTISAKESMRIIDNPLDWLQGQLTLKQDYQQYNAAASKAALASKSIGALTTSIDEYTKTQESLALKITDTSRAAAADVRIAEGVAVKNAATQNHLRDELAITAAIQNATAEQAIEAQKQLGIVMDQRRFAQDQERMAMAREQFNWEKQSKQLALKSKSDGDATKAALLQQYNIGAPILGLPQERSFDLLMARSELGGTDKVRISAAMEAGGNTLASQATRASSTPGGAVSMIVQGVYPRANESTFAPMKKYLKDTWDTKTGLPGAQGKNGAAFVVEATNAQIKADTEVYTKNAVANGSFYAPPSIKSITDTAAVQATPLYRKVLATAGKDLTTAAPAPVIELAYAAAKTGVISYEEAAAGVSTFYRQAASINNTTKRFSQIGIQPQISFKVKPQIRQLEDVRGGETFDLTDHSQSLRMFTILKSRDTVGQLKSFFGGN